MNYSASNFVSSLVSFLVYENIIIGMCIYRNIHNFHAYIINFALRNCFPFILLIRLLKFTYRNTFTFHTVKYTDWYTQIWYPLWAQFAYFFSKNTFCKKYVTQIKYVYNIGLEIEWQQHNEVTSMYKTYKIVTDMCIS